MAARGSAHPTGIAQAFSSKPHKLSHCFPLALNVSDIHLLPNFGCLKNSAHSLARLSSHVHLEAGVELTPPATHKLLEEEGC